MKIGSIIILLLLAIVPAAWANKKGHSAIVYYILSLVLSPLISTIIVACLNDKNNMDLPTSDKQDENNPKEKNIEMVTQKSSDNEPIERNQERVYPPSVTFGGGEDNLAHQSEGSIQRLYCRKCGKEINPDASFCRFCGTKTLSHVSSESESVKSAVFIQLDEDHIRCVKCGTVQRSGRTKCWGCGISFDEVLGEATVNITT